MVIDPNSSRSHEAQILLEEQTQSLLSAYLQKEISMKRFSRARDATHLMMLSDLVKELLSGYTNLNDSIVHQMDWLCPLLTSCAQAKDPSIQKAMRVIIDRLISGGNDAIAAKVPAEEKMEKTVADV